MSPPVRSELPDPELRIPSYPASTPSRPRRGRSRRSGPLTPAQGARTCILYTDLANPTSNKIYAGVGYRRFIDWEEHEFGRG